MRDINYEKVLENINIMINTLEFDAMRSAGKAKQAILELQAMYQIKDRYESILKPTPKPIPVKKGGK